MKYAVMAPPSGEKAPTHDELGFVYKVAKHKVSTVLLTVE